MVPLSKSGLHDKWSAGSNPALSAIFYSARGEVLEWPIRHAWRACVAQATAGSNPALSATIIFYQLFYCVRIKRFVDAFS